MPDFHTVAEAASIPDNSSVAAELNGLALLVCNADGNFYVVENRCTHQNQPLAGGRIRSGYLSCPIHGMRYKLETGDPLGQLSKQPLRTFPTRVVEGRVEVSLGAE